jgi:hypothetical protein
VGIILERNDVDEIISGYVLSEIPPSDRSFSFNLNKIPSNYYYRGGTVGGLKFVLERNILFITQVDNFLEI